MKVYSSLKRFCLHLTRQKISRMIKRIKEGITLVAKYMSEVIRAIFKT